MERLDSEENLHIVYSMGHSISYKKLNPDGDVIFNINISDDSELSYQPNVVIDSNDNVHITWLETKLYAWEVCYTKFDNMGNNLIDEKVISLADGNSSCWVVSSCLNTGVDSDDNIHIVWDDIRDYSDYRYSLYYSKLDNNGNTIIDDMRITDISDSRTAGIVIDSNDNINIIWTYNEYNENYSSEPDELHYTKMNSNGEMLIEDLTLANQDFIGWPSFDIDSKDNIIIVWADEGRAIYKIVIDNNGNILENTTEFLEGHGYTALSINKHDYISVIWSKYSGTYLSLPKPIDSNNNIISSNGNINEGFYIAIGILILILIIIFIVYIGKKKK